MHPRTSLETPPPANPLPAPPKKGAGTSAQTAGGAAQPTVTGLYAQSLKRKSTAAADDDSGAGYSTQSASEGESSAATGDQGSSSAGDASGAFNASALQTYTARGSLSGPPSLAGEIFETTV